MVWPTTTSNGTSASTTIRWGPPPPVEQYPVLNGTGPAECSSCTEVSVRPVNIWDVNGYYRDLGVSTRATRKELMRAYQEHEGQASHRLTYVFHQLLNPLVRKAYDCTPFGEVFLDEYVRDILNKKAKAEMSKRMADLHAAGVDLDNVDSDAVQRDVYADMGFETLDRDEEDGDTPVEAVDQDEPVKQDVPSPAKFEYSYYLWRTRLRDPALGLDILSQWQRFLVSALAREGVTTNFAVGLHGEPQRWLEALVGYRTVFFLNVAEPPTEELARDVAQRVRLDRDRKAAAANPSQSLPR